MSATSFEEHRPRLLAVAYGMLGSVVEAEDVVQEAWLRWSTTDQDAIREPGAFLTTVVTRLALDVLGSARRRRERYVGPWLPEPIVTEVGHDPADVVAEAEQLSVALLMALERLNPIERAVFVLRDLFDWDYGDVAAVVDRTATTCRQIARRARDRVGDHTRATTRSLDHERSVVEAIMVAASSGDMSTMVELLADDAVAWGDGGGKRPATRKPSFGADAVARVLTAVVVYAARLGVTARLARANGEVAVLAELDGQPYAVMVVEVRDNQVTALRSVVNPDKLTHLVR